jgi:hypothetical protein
MPYDIFISYASADRAWAKRLNDDLTARRVKCFLDQERLVKGEKWEPQLQASLQDSRHFVVLWSNQARGSDWVQAEVQLFKRMTDTPDAGSGRKLYAINLESSNATLAAYQVYIDAGIQADYQAFQAPNGRLLASAEKAWDKIVGQIAAANPALLVPVAVLAMTTDILDQQPPVTPDLDQLKGRPLDEFLGRLGLGTVADLRTRYQSSPFEWHPFGTPETIRTLLDALLWDPATGINLKLKKLNQPPVEWSELDVLAPSDDQIDEAYAPLLAGPCVVIVDPISLFSYPIYQRYMALGPVFANPLASILFLTPCIGPPPLDFLRRCLKAQGRHTLEWFHDPIPYSDAHANCGVNVADRWEIRRLVLASLGRKVTPQTPTNAAPILSP